MDPREDLCRREDAGWTRLHALLERLSPAALVSPVLNDDGWSPKDVMFHIGAWQAEAGRQLDRMRAGTYEEPELDIDAVNAAWLELSRDLDLKIAEAELIASRARLLKGFASLPEITPAAEEWFTESGELHYREHLPELQTYADRMSD